MEKKSNKDMEVVEGIGNLDISSVYENTTTAKPKMKDEKPKNIVVPKSKKANNNEDKKNKGQK